MQRETKDAMMVHGREGEGDGESGMERSKGESKGTILVKHARNSEAMRGNETEERLRIT